MDLLEAGACVLWPGPFRVRPRDLRGAERDRGLRRCDEHHAIFMRHRGFLQTSWYLQIIPKSALASEFWDRKPTPLAVHAQ